MIKNQNFCCLSLPGYLPVLINCVKNYWYGKGAPKINTSSTFYCVKLSMILAHLLKSSQESGDVYVNFYYFFNLCFSGVWSYCKQNPLPWVTAYTIISAAPGGGALPYKSVRDVPFFRVSCFSLNPEPGTKIAQKFLNRL